jgi:hypothetical protein
LHGSLPPFSFNLQIITPTPFSFLQYLAFDKVGTMLFDVAIDQLKDRHDSCFVQRIDAIFAVPPDVHEAAISQALQIMRDPALLKPRLFAYFFNTLWPAPKRKHNF